MRIRPSLVLQYICFSLVSLSPLLWLAGVELVLVMTAAAVWLAFGVAAALWNRNVVDS